MGTWARVFCARGPVYFVPVGQIFLNFPGQFSLMLSFRLFADDELSSDETADIMLPLCIRGQPADGWDPVEFGSLVRETKIPTPGSGRLVRIGNSFRDIYRRFGILFLVSGELVESCMVCDFYMFKNPDEVTEKIIEKCSCAAISCAAIRREEKHHKADGAFSPQSPNYQPMSREWDSTKRDWIETIVNNVRADPPRTHLARIVRSAAGSIIERDVHMCDEDFMEFIGRCSGDSATQGRRRRGAVAFMKQLRGH